jgi:general secretion pathway protein B
MSYILDALKKAEAERNLGATPNLHAQPISVAPSIDRPSFWRRRWMWIALPVLAAVLIASVLLRPWDAAPQPPAATAALPEQAPARAAQATPLPAPATPPVTASTASPPEDVAPPPREKATPAKPAAVPEARQAKKPAEKKTAKASATAEQKPATDTPPADERRVATLRELPDNIQREIPTLSVNGYLYSRNKADRTVLINQRLLREGDQVAPDLVLERLTPTGMVLSYKGHRYSTSY